MAIGDKNNIGPDRDGGPSIDNSSTRSGGGSMMGGLIGGYFQNRLAKKQREHEERMAEQAYQRSLPWGSQSALGSVSFDPETKEMLQELSPEMQELMGNWLGLSKGASDELAAMQADPYAMEQEQFQRFEDMNANAYNQSRLQGQEAALASGRMGGTQGYYDSLATEDAINQNRMAGQMASIGTGMNYRNMLGGESLNFGKSSLDVANSLMGQADLGRMIGQGSKNAFDPFGSRNYTDTQSNMLTQFMGDSFGRKKQFNKDGKVIQEQEDGMFSKYFSPLSNRRT
jgi:hypothetical protein|tara:strand:+ start:42 stop:896 length:855 start_codon:yes stop_codon:yes gene_type:complete